MENPNLLASQKAVLAGVVDPDALTAATHDSGWIDMALFEQIQAIIAVGTLGTNATVDAKLQQATDAAGAGAKDIAGKAITQLTQAGADSDKQAIINCRSEELDVNNSFTHVRLRITVAVATSDGGAVVLGHAARYQVADDLASVAEVVA